MSTTASQSGASVRAGIAAGFRKAREAAGMSARELASLLGTSSAAILDLETNDEELFVRFSLAECQLIVEALGIPPAKLLQCESEEPPISLDELRAALQAWIAAAPPSLAEFEARAGWRVSRLLAAPELLSTDVTLDALEQLCAGAGVDWRRVIAGL